MQIPTMHKVITCIASNHQEYVQNWIKSENDNKSIDHNFPKH